MRGQHAKRSQPAGPTWRCESFLSQPEPHRSRRPLWHLAVDEPVLLALPSSHAGHPPRRQHARRAPANLSSWRQWHRQSVTQSGRQSSRYLGRQKLRWGSSNCALFDAAVLRSARDGRVRGLPCSTSVRASAGFPTSLVAPWAFDQAAAVLRALPDKTLRNRLKKVLR